MRVLAAGVFFFGLSSDAAALILPGMIEAETALLTSLQSWPERFYA
jgi:hypothetical protein